MGDPRFEAEAARRREESERRERRQAEQQAAAARKGALVGAAQRASREPDLTRAWEQMRPLWEQWGAAGWAGPGEEERLRYQFDDARRILKERSDRERRERDDRQARARAEKERLIRELRSWRGASDRRAAWAAVKTISEQFWAAPYAGKEANAELAAVFKASYDDFRRWSNGESLREIDGKISDVYSWMRDLADRQRQVEQRLNEQLSWGDPHPRDPHRADKLARRAESISRSRASLEAMRQKRDSYQQRLNALREQRARYL